MPSLAYTWVKFDSMYSFKMVLCCLVQSFLFGWLHLVLKFGSKKFSVQKRLDLKTLRIFHFCPEILMIPLKSV